VILLDWVCSDQEVVFYFTEKNEPSNGNRSGKDDNTSIGERC
jgi:hypothetical protein